MLEHDAETELWKALADVTRRSILDTLRTRPHTTGELCAIFSKLDRCSVMKHLEILVAAKLVLVRRNGRERFNSLNAAPLLHIVARWVGRFEASWLENAARIEELLKEGK